MKKFQLFNFFPYSWSFEDEETNKGVQTIIRSYGWNIKNESVYIRIEDFSIPLFVELPYDFEWNNSLINTLCNKLQYICPPKFKPLSICFEMKHRSYYAYVELSQNGPFKYSNKKFPYLMVLFRNTKAFSYFSNIIRKDINIPGIGNIKLKCHSYEKSVTPVLKLLAIRKLPSAGWMRIKGILIERINKESTRTHEYAVSFKDMEALTEEESNKMPFVYPKVFSFDNEANSTISSSMPKPHRPGDKTFQIGYTILVPEKNNKPKEYRKVLLSLGNPDEIPGVTVKRCKTEADLMIQLTRDIVSEDPEVVLGYNILGWDINYMIERCKKICFCLGEFDKMGCIEGKHSPEEPISWSSSAFGKQEFIFLNAEGRLFIDLLPYVKRNYKLHNYRLETVCEEFLKDINKDPLKPKDIFNCYKEFSPKSLALVGTYCVQDSFVALLLYEKLLVWSDLTESATVNQVPMFDMFTKGQQIKLYAQFYRYCFNHNIVVESNAYITKKDEHFSGAYVSEPIKGLYDMIVPFDFASLYPSIMMAYNIDYQKLVIDDKIPDKDCHVMEWQEHSYCKCPKDEFKNKKPPKMKDGTLKMVCSEYKYRWLKHEVSGKGILPTLLENLIKARKNTRKIINENEKEIKFIKRLISLDLKIDNEELNSYKSISNSERVKLIDDVLGNSKNTEDNLKTICKRLKYLEEINIVLDRRQAAYKCNANSMYGATGVKKGYLPFIPAAMCVTYMGRTNIQKVNIFIEEKHNGKVIYNDTDSAYCYFEDFKDKYVSDLWKHSEKIVLEIKSLFPPPLSLEFEEKIYKKFLILSKKRYVAQAVNEEGKEDSKLLKRGVILQRRDNCKILREVYQDLVMKIFDNHSELVKLKEVNDIKVIMRNCVVKELLKTVIFSINTLFQFKYGLRDFVITKQMSRTPDQYKNINKLPSHVILALKMQSRGIPIAAGVRIEYVITKNKNFHKRDNQKEKLLDINYFFEFREIFRISYLDYLKQMINPIDQLFEVVMNVKDFVYYQFEQRILYQQIVEQIGDIGGSKIIFVH